MTLHIQDVFFDGGDGQSGPTVKAGGLVGFDGTDFRGEAVLYPAGHGAFDLPSFSQPRTASVSGLCLADSDERLGWWRRKLTGLFTSGPERVSVDYLGERVWGDARLALGSRTRFDVVVPGSIAEYQIQFTFNDPRLYGESRSFASGVPSFHFGTFPASPLIRVTGSSSGGYTVNGPDGKAYVVTRPLVTGHPHTIDMLDGRLRVDGALVFGGVSRADVWTVPAGQTVTHTLSGSGTLSVTVRDTFL